MSTRREAFKLPKWNLLYFKKDNTTGTYSKNVLIFTNENKLATVEVKGEQCIGKVLFMSGKNIFSSSVYGVC